MIIIRSCTIWKFDRVYMLCDPLVTSPSETLFLTSRFTFNNSGNLLHLLSGSITGFGVPYTQLNNQQLSVKIIFQHAGYQINVIQNTIYEF